MHLYLYLGRSFYKTKCVPREFFCTLSRLGASKCEITNLSIYSALLIGDFSEAKQQQISFAQTKNITLIFLGKCFSPEGHLAVSGVLVTESRLCFTDLDNIVLLIINYYSNGLF